MLYKVKPAYICLPNEVETIRAMVMNVVKYMVVIRFIGFFITIARGHRNEIVAKVSNAA